MATTAEEGDKREPPGLGVRTRRSAATSDMASGGGSGAPEREGNGEGDAAYVLSLPAAALPLRVAVAYLDAAVPRKLRSLNRLRAQPHGWWAFKLPVPVPPPPAEARAPVPRPPAAKKNPAGKARPPRPKRPLVPLSQLPDSDTQERPAKRARRCLQCGATVTPQWRSGPLGRSTLCNACGVRLKAAGALREPPAHRAPPVAATAPPPAMAPVVAPQPPESPGSESPTDSPIWEPGSVPDVYLVRKKPPKRGKLTPTPPPPAPRTEPAPPPPSPAVYLVKKKKPTKNKKKPAKSKSKSKPYRPRKTSKRCLHCGSTSTPQWREGPMGRSTLCNACGVRYRQGRLLPEYRPLASPTFQPSEHANRHSQVLALHRQRDDAGDRSRGRAPPPPRSTDDGPRIVSNGARDDVDMGKLQVRRRLRDDMAREYPPTPLHNPLPQPADTLAAGAVPLALPVPVGARIDSDMAGPAAGCGSGSGEAPTISLDSMLLNGPSAPLIVDGDDPLID